MTAGPLGGADDSGERLSPEDLATRREEQFLAAALRAQQRAAQAPTGTPGVCSNCSAQCLPQAVYCDEDCRADHEQRKRILARQGRAA
jgi:hypothetical protein